MEQYDGSTTWNRTTSAWAMTAYEKPSSVVASCRSSYGGERLLFNNFPALRTAGAPKGFEPVFTVRHAFSQMFATLVGC